MTDLQKTYALVKKNPKREPALNTGIATGSYAAGLLGLLTFIFPNINQNYLIIVVIAVAFVLPIITAVFTRGKVWSPATVKDLIEESTKEAVETMKELQNKNIDIDSEGRG